MIRVFMILTSFLFAPVAMATETIAFIGDSLTAGAVIQPEVKFDADSLWNIAMGRTSTRGPVEFPGAGELGAPLERPLVVPETAKNYQNAALWFPSSISQMASWRFINRPDYSWANLLAQELSFPPSHVLLAATNGAKSKAGSEQMARILSYTKLKMPDHLFIFFTGNDVCSPFLRTITTEEQYKNNIMETLSYALRHAEFRQGGKYKIYLPSFMPINQVYSSKYILEKKVRAHGKVMTCEELLQTKKEPWNISSQDPIEVAQANLLFNVFPFPKNQAAYCPSLFGKAVDSLNKDPQEHRSLIANRIRMYRESLLLVQKEMAARLQKRKRDFDLQVIVLQDTAQLQFVEADIAEDCFHLSAQGQWRVAQTILGELRASQL